MRADLQKARFIFSVIVAALLAIGAGLCAASSGASNGHGANSHNSAKSSRPRPDEVTGEVALTQSGSDTAPDASQVVVWLTPSGSTTMPHTIDQPRYRLVQ